MNNSHEAQFICALLAVALAVSGAIVAEAEAQTSDGINSMVLRATNSISALLTSARHTKKDEHQSIVVNDGQQLNLAQQQHHHHQQQHQMANVSAINNSHPPVPNYREQGEQLRQEIVRRSGQLQQVVAGSMEVLKNSSDLIVRRLLEQLNNRLDQAKSKADKIINEPATNEVAIKALNTINQGLNNLNNIITNIVNGLDLNNKDNNTNLLSAIGSEVASQRFRLNFHQIGKQFSSALNAAQQQQQQRQSPGSTFAAGPNNNNNNNNNIIKVQ